VLGIMSGGRTEQTGSKATEPLSAVFGRRARRRLLHLLAGGLLAVLYLVLATILAKVLGITARPGPLIAPTAVPLAAAVAGAVGLLHVAGDLETAIARALLGLPADQVTRARVRPALWHVVHVTAGGLAGLAIATLPVLAFIAWTPAGGLAVLLLVLGAAGAIGAGLARLAPRLLGPSAGERASAAERRAAELAGRNRVARELHDSVGHSLSVVTIQASAAQRVLDTDPAFADQALTAVGETARRALEDLDYALGVLRDAADAGDAADAVDAADAGDADPAAVPLTLDDLGRLTAQLERAGLTVTSEITGDVARLPFAVSREAYRIVQEGLANALWHGGAPAATLRIDVGPDRLRLEVINPAGRGPGHHGRGRPAAGGGHGLDGIAERAAVLHGEVSAGPDRDGRWRLRADLPLRAAP
jgi:signal transduction histidine kinase